MTTKSRATHPPLDSNGHVAGGQIIVKLRRAVKRAWADLERAGVSDDLYSTNTTKTMIRRMARDSLLFDEIVIHLLYLAIQHFLFVVCFGLSGAVGSSFFTVSHCTTTTITRRLCRIPICTSNLAFTVAVRSASSRNLASKVVNTLGVLYKYTVTSSLTSRQQATASC